MATLSTPSLPAGFRPSTAPTMADIAEEADERAPDVVSSNRTVQTADNLVGGAITLGLGLMIVVLMALVVGYFAAEVPSDGAFSEAINSTVDVGNTAFIIFGVSLLAIPVVGIVAYFYRSGLGSFIDGGMGR